MAVAAVTVDRFEGELVVLRLPDGQELVLPSALLPPGSREGSVLNLSLTGAQGEAAGAATARQLLTELLQGGTEAGHGST